MGSIGSFDEPYGSIDELYREHASSECLTMPITLSLRYGAMLHSGRVGKSSGEQSPGADVRVSLNHFTAHMY